MNNDFGIDLRYCRTQPSDGLAATAERLYPGDTYLQQEWLRAVRLVRATRTGWLLDKRQERRNG